MEARLWDTVTRLQPLKPHFVSVTYGAGGSTRERTARTVARILTESTPDAGGAPDLRRRQRATRSTRSSPNSRRWASSASWRCAAIRPKASALATGRIPAAMPTAPNWSAALKASGDFDISVSAYPEKHPESPDFATDIEMLKRKVDNGATRAITQFFFDNDLYERYVERVRRAGIYIPIVPGILPVHNFAQVANFSARCGALVPAWLAERFEGLDKDPQTHALVASAVAAEQVLDLVERGVGDFHFYTMNRADLAFAICHMIGIRGAGGEDGRCGGASAAA